MGINFEHSFSDGMTWNRWMLETWSDLYGTPSPYSPLPQPVREVESGSTLGPAGGSVLSWELTDEMCGWIDASKDTFENTVNDLDTHVLEFNHFGKVTCTISY